MPLGDIEVVPVANALSGFMIKRTSISMDDALKNRIVVPDASPVSLAKAGLWSDWRFWVQWGTQLPLQGTDYYFTGQSLTSHPYRVLIPGLRVEKGFGDASISLDVKPITDRTLKPVVFQSNTIKVRDSTSINDSTLVSTNALIKQFGSSAALQINYVFKKHWGVSAGVDATLWRGQLLRARADHVNTGKISDSL